jgi:hypothetical protein
MTDTDYVIFIIIIILSEERLSPLGTAAITGLFYQPHMIEDCECGTIGGMKIGRRLCYQGKEMDYCSVDLYCLLNTELQ